MSGKAAKQDPRTVACDGCGEEVAKAYCFTCVQEDDDELDLSSGGDAARHVRNYADRRKMLGLMSPEVFAAFELCAEDLEARHG